MTNRAQTIIVIAGPNGAGKSTAAPRLPRDTLSIDDFVNADVIAQGLSGFDPESVAIEAGRLMIMRLDELEKEGRNFPFESTLAEQTTTRRVARYAAAGASVTINCLWLPNADLAIQRVQSRVHAGGHGIRQDIIRRRFSRSLLHFHSLRQLPTLSWRLIDSSVTSVAPTIASGAHGRLTITDSARWEYVQHQLRVLRDEEGTVRESASERCPALHLPNPSQAPVPRRSARSSSVPRPLRPCSRHVRLLPNVA